MGPENNQDENDTFSVRGSTTLEQKMTHFASQQGHTDGWPFVNQTQDPTMDQGRHHFESSSQRRLFCCSQLPLLMNEVLRNADHQVGTKTNLIKKQQNSFYIDREARKDAREKLSSYDFLDQLDSVLLFHG